MVNHRKSFGLHWGRHIIHGGYISRKQSPGRNMAGVAIIVGIVRRRIRRDRHGVRRGNGWCTAHRFFRFRRLDFNGFALHLQTSRSSRAVVAHGEELLRRTGLLKGDKPESARSVREFVDKNDTVHNRTELLKEGTELFTGDYIQEKGRKLVRKHRANQGKQEERRNVPLGGRPPTKSFRSSLAVGGTLSEGRE